MVLSTNPVVLVSLPKSTNERPSIMTFPANTYTFVPHGYGSYRLEAISRLSEIEGRPALLSETIEDMVGIRVAGYVKTEIATDVDVSSHEQLFSALKSETSLTKLLSGTNTSNLNLLDKWLLSAQFMFSRPDDWVFLLAHDRESVFRQTELPGMTNIRIPDRNGLVEFTNGQFSDPDIRASNLSIDVRNATSTPRIGQAFTRILVQLGGRVITVTNEVRSVATCLVVGEETEKKQKLVQYVLKEYGCDYEVAEVAGADIALFVGDSFAKRWSENREF